MKEAEELKEYRSLDLSELQNRMRAAEGELMSLRFRHSSGQLPQSGQLQKTRRRVARLKTILAEKSKENE